LYIVNEELSPLEKVLDRLKDYTVRKDEYRARCPAHNGNSDDSLSIKESEDGRALLRCHANCEIEDILEALDLSTTDLFVKGNGHSSPGAAKKARKATGSGNKKHKILTTDELPDGTYWEFTSPAGEVLYLQRHKREYYRKVGEDRWVTYRGVLDDIAQVLYRLPELIDGVRSGKTVYHLEGPKDVETARGRLGVVATTSGSTSSWRPEFRAHYTGADVVVISDNDAPGRKYADTVARDLLRVARSVKVVEPPGLDEGGDLTDWVDAGHTPEEFFALVEESPAYGPEEEVPWPEPVPLEIKLPSVQPLDELMVPEPLREWVLDTSRRMDNAPPDFAAAAAIVVAGALVGRKVGVRPKRNDDWTVIPNLWGGLVGLPASMKTPTLNQVLGPVKRLAAEARERHEEVLKEHELDMMVVSAEKAALKKELEVTAKKVVSASASRGDLDGIRADLEDLEEPDPPTPRRYTTNDTSIEKMAELLMDNPDGLLLYRDELTGWLRSLDKAGHEAARAFYLEGWNGDGSHEVDRIGRGSLFVKALCVSVLGGIQPGPLSSYVEGAFDDGESADGLLQRLQVLVYPDRGRFEPTDLSPDLDARDQAHNVFKGLADLDVEKFVGHALGESEEVPYLNFGNGAQEVFNDWRAAFEGEVVAGDYPAALESHFMKFRSLFASLALVFEAIDFVGGVEGAGVVISKVNAMRAYAWCEYLRSHAVRIYSPMLDTAEKRAAILLERIHRGDVDDGVKTRDIWRRGWSRLGTAGDLAEAIALLEGLGWVRREEVKPNDGGRPSEILRLHPELRE
jgi:Protein of unknown function (DUF3987)